MTASYNDPSQFYEIHSQKDGVWVYVGTVKASNPDEACEIFRKRHQGEPIAAKIKAKQLKKFPKIPAKFKK